MRTILSTKCVPENGPENDDPETDSETGPKTVVQGLVQRLVQRHHGPTSKIDRIASYRDCFRLLSESKTQAMPTLTFATIRVKRKKRKFCFVFDPAGFPRAGPVHQEESAHPRDALDVSRPAQGILSNDHAAGGEHVLLHEGTRRRNGK